MIGLGCSSVRDDETRLADNVKSVEARKGCSAVISVLLQIFSNIPSMTMGKPSLSGFSIDDFIHVGQSARSVYERCQGSSSGPFSSLAGDVLRLGNSINDLQVLTKQRILAPEKEAELLEIGKSCYGSMAQLETMLVNYKSLGTHDRRGRNDSMSDKAARDMRARLLSSITLLTAFYSDIRRYYCGV